MKKKLSFIHFNSEVTSAIVDDGERSNWMFFSSLKDLLKDVNYVSKSDVSKLNIPYSKATRRKYFKRLVAADYIRESKNGYYLHSIRKVLCRKFGIENLKNYGYIYIQGETIQEVMARLSYNIVKYNIKGQMKQNMSKSKMAIKVKQSDFLRSEYSCSVRRVASFVGYKSAMSGTNMEKAWEKLGLAKIERSTKAICHVSMYNAVRLAYDGVEERCFLIGDTVYVRNVNNIIPVA